MRKDVGFEVIDHIIISVQNNDKIANIVAKNTAQIQSIVLADFVVNDDLDGFTKEWNLNGEDVVLTVKKN
jgi:isoleucyl-tRNA synthetase